MLPYDLLPDKSSRGFILALVIFFVVIIAAGALFYQSQEEQIKNSVSSDLSSIALLKADQIAGWRGERLADANILSRDRFFIDGVNEYLSSPDTSRRQKILALFDEINTSYPYQNVQLTDRNGRVQLSLKPSETEISPALEMQLARSIATHEVILTDLSVDTDGTTPQMYAIAPLIVADNGKTELVGLLILTIDPAVDLYPYIQSWPVPSQTAETLLVEREGDYVLFLNVLRHRNEPALNLILPLSRTDLPAVNAVLGTTGVFIGKDYRGVDVISALRPIPGSPWFMVAKIDTEEAYSAWQSRSMLIIALVAGTLVAALIIAGLVWQRRQKYYYQALYAVQSDRNRAGERNRVRLETLVHLAGMESATEPELAGIILRAECRLTDSPLAFIGILGPDERVFDLVAWSDPAMNESPGVFDARLPTDNAGIWAEAVRKRKSLLENNYSASPGEANDPLHIPVTRFISVPVFEGQRMVMICTVANKETGYSPLDLEDLTLLMQGIWPYLQKRVADEALRQKNTDLESAYEEITASDEELRANYDEIARTQRALEASERRYRNLYQYAQVGLFETSFKDGTVVACNEQYATLAGFSSIKDAIGKEIRGLYVNPEDRTEVGRILREHGSIRNHIAKFRNCQTGRIFWAQFSARFNYDRDVAEGSIVDITALKDAENALRENEKRLRDAQEMAHLGFWLWDTRTGSVEWSDELYKIFGLDPKEFVPQIDSILALSPWPEDHERDRELIQRAMESHDAGTYEQRFLRPDKSVGYYHSTFQGRYDDEGNLTLMVGTVLDITERKLSESRMEAMLEKLRESEDAFRSLAENANDGFLVGASDGLHVFANKRAAEITGYSIDELVHLTIRQIAHPEEFERVIQDRFRKHMAGEPAPNQYETILVSKDGRDIPIELSSSRVEWYGQPADLIVFRDITERKQITDTLRESETRLSLALEVGNAGVWEWNLENNEVTFDARFHELLGYTPGDLPATLDAWMSFHNPEDVPVWMAKAETYLRGETPVYESEHRIRTKTGEWAWVFTRGQRVKPQAPGPSKRFIGIAMNVTKRREAEEILRHANERLRHFVDANIMGIVIASPSGEIIEANDYYLDLIGYTRKEFEEGMIDWRALTPPECLQADEHAIEELRKKGTCAPYEKEYIRRDGTRVSVLLSDAMLPGPDEQIAAFVLDISEQKRAGVQLKSSEMRYRRLFESAKEGILILNRDTGMIIDANPFIESLLGYAPHAIIGKHLWDIGLFKELLLSKIAFADLQKNEYIRYDDLPLETTGGQKIDVEFVSNVYLTDPGTSVIQCSIRDITDRKKMELQREILISELEQKNTELERFTYTVSHDLRSPLITIKGFAGLLEADTLIGDPLQLKKDIQRILDAADMMQNLLVDLTDLSHVGKIVNPLQKIPFGTIAHEAVNLLAGPLADRNVMVRIAPDLPVVNVDHTRIREVMVNLIENAIRFLGDRADPEIQIGVDMDGETAVFFMRDNGIGIDPRYLDRIFNLFERLDASSPGTGIGLTIVRRIIEGHGGKCWAESEGPGKGTTFRFTLPVVPELKTVSGNG